MFLIITYTIIAIHRGIYIKIYRKGPLNAFFCLIHVFSDKTTIRIHFSGQNLRVLIIMGDDLLFFIKFQLNESFGPI